MKTYKYQCEKCSSEDVQGLMWVGLNDNVVDDSSMDFNESQDLWCNNCQEHCQIKTIEIDE